jgi:hypothetical protein
MRQQVIHDQSEDTKHVKQHNNKSDVPHDGQEAATAKEATYEDANEIKFETRQQNKESA